MVVVVVVGGISEPFSKVEKHTVHSFFEKPIFIFFIYLITARVSPLARSSLASACSNSNWISCSKVVWVSVASGFWTRKLRKTNAVVTLWNRYVSDGLQQRQGHGHTGEHLCECFVRLLLGMLSLQMLLRLIKLLRLEVTSSVR